MNFFPSGLSLLTQPQRSAYLTLRQRTLQLAPVAYWPLSETTGISAPSLAGSFTGTYTPNSAGSWTGGTLNQNVFITGQGAPLFNGTTGYVALTSAPLPFTATPSFTISLWLKMSPAAGQRSVFSQASSTTTSVIQINSTNLASTLSVRLRNTANTSIINVNTLGTLVDGNWHHFAFAVSSTNYTTYIDGVVDRSLAYTLAGAFSFDRTSIGAMLAATASTFWSGNAAEVSMFNRVLSGAEISAMTGDRFH